MADFYQNGIITTLHNIANRPVDDLEKELLGFSKQRPMGLILPSLFSELEGPALQKHCQRAATSTVFIANNYRLRQSRRKPVSLCIELFKSLDQNHKVLWNDGPRLQALDKELQALGVAPRELGKGRNVWYCMGYKLLPRRLSQ